MGVLNVTPDSFSGDGYHHRSEAAIERGLRLWEDGADIVDVGGESTRPGYTGVPLSEELSRVEPVVRGLVERGVAVSIDTQKSAVAARAIELGARLVNDVSGGADPDMVDVVAASNAGLVLVHAQHIAPRPEAITEVCADLEQLKDIAGQAGIPRGRLWIDPGLGFGKAWRSNLWILHGLHQLRAGGVPILVGPSRKGTIARVVGGGPTDRAEASLALAGVCIMQGAAMIRMHDVAAAVRLARMIDALAGGVESAALLA